VTPVPVSAPTLRPRRGAEPEPGDADALVVDDGIGGRHLFVVDGSRLYELDDHLADEFSRAVEHGRSSELLDRFGLTGRSAVDDTPLAPPPVRSLSLAVAQKCNLGCTYCYAQQGDFGMAPRNMTFAEARRAVELLFGDAEPGARVTLAFMGGEPLVNRPVIRAVTELAAARGRDQGVDVRFSITTNGTLVTPDDGAFFEEHGFAVTVSLDGDREHHDRQRPFRHGRGSFDVVLERVMPLLAAQERMQVSARVTITPRNLRVPDTVDELITLGFHSVGVSPLLASPTGAGEVASTDLEVLLEQMVATADEYERRAVRAERYPFANVVNALREIDRGTHRPYPCGAGAGYLGVAAGGELSACHRFVGDGVGRMGDLDSGVDEVARSSWLADRHVHRQEPCRSCWARYLCGGGCHHEVIARGRPACDYIRGWLQHCLGLYARLSAAGVVFTEGSTP
jgi:uncharacterized protein